MILVLAEKPSVARDLAAALGATGRRQGYFEGAGYRVTWAIGHLVGLAEPHEIEPAWRRWSRASLPMLPQTFPLVVLDTGRAQYRVVERLLRDRSTSSVIAATDAGREGELIFRYIYELAGCVKPWQRLWVSSLTPAAIRAGFARLSPGERYDGLAAAARARSRADWLVGMNLSRLYTLAHGTLYTVGRVQTPTLAMVVERDRAIRAFVPEHYIEVEATFEGERGRYRGTYHAGSAAELRTDRGKLRAFEPERARLPPDGELARAIAERARTGSACVRAVDRQQRRTPPPLLYDLTELQRHANRLFGYTAQRTLDAAQALYEKHKLLSYPRTDCRHLSRDAATLLPAVVQAISPAYPGLIAEGSGERPLGARFVNDAKVTDHHALIPTSERARLTAGSPEARVYDLVCRRVLMAWHADRLDALSVVVTEIVQPAAADAGDLYVTRGSSLEQAGWSVLDYRSARAAAPAAPDVPAGLSPGDAQSVVLARLIPKQTEPPRPYTEGTLLTAMETAGKALDDKALMDALREAGLGTPATRAATIEALIGRRYLQRDGKNLAATAAGEALVDAVHPQVKSAAMTGAWELRLRRVERGEEAFEHFMRDVEGYVREVVGSRPSVAATPPAFEPGAVRAAPAAAAPARRKARAPGKAMETPGRSIPPPSAAKHPTPAGRTAALSASPRFHAADPNVSGASIAPGMSSASIASGASSASIAPGVSSASRASSIASGASLLDLLRRHFGLPGFRPQQAEICESVCAGRDVLVVMPTGAGKSLCYQLPGLARGGTTLVVSPLIALIEDQCAQLAARGLRAERIHSGRDRSASQAVCAAYLRGELDYLFIAPERLGIAGFPALLAKRPPGLIAIDEAHCISQWGHDFRPDYRLLRDRLAPLRPAPIVALTATATPAVQRDIVEQLGMSNAQPFILGFYRDNLAIELANCPKVKRIGAARAILAAGAALPAIVYTPTRDSAERTAKALGVRLRAGAYHAGLGARERAQVQERWMAGQLDCIVATVAFGMGIDKPNVRTVLHTALPSSLEGYYQEIGRAGRDGQASRAILLHAAVDRRLHEFFLESDYPPERQLARIYAQLSSEPATRAQLAARLGAKSVRALAGLEKLWMHGGAAIDGELVTRGLPDWRERYARKRAHRLEQLDAVERYVAAERCRMQGLVQHFGSAAESDRVCGVCDVCVPARGAAVAAVQGAAAVRSPRPAQRRGGRGSAPRRTPARRRRRRGP